METTQFSLRMEPELLRQIDGEAEEEYKTRTELIKEAIVHLLKEREEQERLKKVAAELWLKGEIPETKLRKVLREEEIKDLKFGKHWIEDVLHESHR
ncbi:MAG: ribbon-helix-helix protein, CopG family [Nanoarchaeota archaeon]